MEVPQVCPVCNEATLISDEESGEIVCSHCGRVLSDRTMETRAEWRVFDAESGARVGIPSSLARHDMGLSTIIGRTDKDASGHQLKGVMKAMIHRLRTWDFRTGSGSATDRNFEEAFTELSRLKIKLSLSDAAVEKTAYLYRKARGKQLVRGRSISSVLDACIYIACRELGVPATLRDISAISGVRRKSLSRNYRLIIRELDIRVPMTDPMKCIVKIANKIGISEKTRRQAMSIMNDLAKTEIPAGKDPMGLAATILYISCLIKDEVVTQKNIAEAAGVTDVTIRNRFKELKSLLSQRTGK